MALRDGTPCCMMIPTTAKRRLSPTSQPLAYTPTQPHTHNVAEKTGASRRQLCYQSIERTQLSRQDQRPAHDSARRPRAWAAAGLRARASPGARGSGHRGSGREARGGW